MQKNVQLKALSTSIIACSVSICSSLAIGSLLPAFANGQPSLRDFRNQNYSLSRSEARRQYRIQYRQQGGRSSYGSSLPLVDGAGVPAVPASLPTALSGGHLNHINNRLQTKTLQLSGSALVRLNSGVNLDLTSAEKNIFLGGNLFQGVQSVEIAVGDETKSFSTGSQVTAAEYVAVKQALSGGGQKLLLSGAGTANGGSLDLTAITGNNDPLRASNLTVASGVTTIGDFGKRSDFSLTGDLNNLGSVIALSSDNKVKGGVIRANNITNGEGALISSMVSDRNGFGGNSAKVDLELNASGDLTNLGKISSSGNLVLSACSQIDNRGVISANDSVTLCSAAVTNGDRIESLAGDVNFDAPVTSALNLNNNGGTVAAHKAINVRTADYAGTFGNNIYGGDLVSQQLNLHSGHGTNDVNVYKLTGTMSQTGAAAHIAASTGALNIGETCLTGDPTFYNTGGDINITGNIIANEDLTIIASGNITQTSTANVTARNNDQGFNITLIAGANITSTSGGANSPTVPGGSAGQATIDGTASATGGRVAFTGATITTVPNTSIGTQPGGDINIYAFRGSAANSGQVDMGQASLITYGSTEGTNGDITIIAGAQNTNAITINFTRAELGQGTSGGSLTLITAQPTAIGGPITYAANGSRSGGSLGASATLSTGANIVTLSAQNHGGDITVHAGGTITQNHASIRTSSFNAHIDLKASSIGNGSGDPFELGGFEEPFTKKALKTLDPGNGTLTAVATTGSVDILRTASTRITLSGSAVGNFNVTTPSSLIIDDVSSSNGQVKIKNTGGGLNINPSAVITAKTLVDIENATNKKMLPSFVIGQNAVISTSNPIGAEPINLSLTNGVAITKQIDYNNDNLTQVGDVRFFGKKPKVLASTNFLTADSGSPITITRGSGDFIFGGGVQIDAGP
ncbi:MAG: hypothetical protein K2X93_20865 [Candidatus Obscuribacterales bacterium]|nr:hypothetical protein [Candidatus Obscuribacterales bacterium]